MKRIWMLEILFLFAILFAMPVNAKSYNSYSTRKHAWGLNVNSEHKVPGNDECGSFSKRRAYYYVKTQKKRLYLTFDCGYENGNTGKILNILKKHKVKAIFFVTESYIKNNPKLVKRMKKEGHMVGNHTVHHPSLPSCSPEKVKKELQDCENTMLKETGYKMDHYMRPPMGEWSDQNLQVIKDMKYSTIFWSMAFYDYDENAQPGAAYIKRQFMKRYHRGAIVLFHVISKSDTDALSDIITEMKDKGYSFGTLNTLGTKNAKITVKIQQVNSKKDPIKITVKCKNEDGEVRIRYFDQNGKRLAKKPVQPGNYKVKVIVRANNIYKTSKTGKIPFTITETVKTKK